VDSQSKPPPISLPLVDEYSTWLIYLCRSVTMPVKNWVKAAVLQAGNDEAFAGIFHNLKGTGKMRVKLDWSECEEKRLLVLAFLTLVTTHPLPTHCTS
jgi:hypothetical protein